MIRNTIIIFSIVLIASFGCKNEKSEMEAFNPLLLSYKHDKGNVIDPKVYNIENFNYNDPHPTEYHPMSKKRTALSKMEEIAILIPGNQSHSGSEIAGWVLDDYSGSNSQLGTLDSTLFSGTEECIHETASGNVDSDSKEELVVTSIYKAGEFLDSYTFAKEYVKITVLDDSSENFIKITEKIIGDGNEGYLNVDMTVGDFDNDGMDEIALVMIKGKRATSFDVIITDEAKLFVLDDASNDLNVIYEKSYTHDNERVDIHIASGNIDDDDSMEIITSVWTKYSSGNNYRTALYYYNFENSTVTELKKHVIPRGLSVIQSDITTGDTDGDGYDELIFVLKNGYFNIDIFDDAVSGYGQIKNIDISSRFDQQMDSKDWGGQYDPYY
jgi:hypothetical protein